MLRPLQWGQSGSVSGARPKLAAEHLLKDWSQKKQSCAAGVVVQEPIKPQQAGSSVEADPSPAPFVLLSFAVLMDERCRALRSLLSALLPGKTEPDLRVQLQLPPASTSAV